MLKLLVFDLLDVRVARSRVVLHEVFKGAVAPARVEVVLLHFFVNLIEIPVIELEATRLNSF